MKMLKTDIPIKAPSIWVRIEELRINRLDRLAPMMKERVEALLEDAKKIGSINGELFDPIVFETDRVDELQRIYYEQGTTNAPTAIYGWHFFGLATDMISKSKKWSVKDSWWRALGKLAERNGLKSGYFWKRKDSPHIYFGTLKDSPSDIARTLYFSTPNWRGVKVFPDQSPEDITGLHKVWKAVGAM